MGPEIERMAAGLHDKLSVLADHAFFRGLPTPILERLVARARVVIYRPLAMVFAKGEDGREVVLNRVGPSEVFGEIALLDGLPRTADATALEPSDILVLDHATLSLSFWRSRPLRLGVWTS